ncbi:chalcone isomerase family protein [Kangiella koreensis]|uniref:Chalcone isomerase domain-containing protein n=1 Tax=Kangiella koreensis (strain DSM 16069 / JCM 12317 / KCTC 12182 / SW-125) TaxID=523791 RepID=C7R8Z9_KANKD|nr:chalcone isomerase family protein [Kangiella koreensis]ACV27789.1 hypothetical protein Kkor_2380 [Kangiella koreensis DSM 16069]
MVGISLLIASPLARAKLEPSVRYQQTDYQLCAQQRVTKALFFDVVDVGVYYPNCQQAENVFDSQPKLLRFSYLREVEGIQFNEGADDFLEDNLTDVEKETCLAAFKDFNTIYKDVADGDYYDLFVTPDQGLNLRLNQSQLAELNQAKCATPYLNIWFGPESMDDDFSELQDKLKSLN